MNNQLPYVQYSTSIRVTYVDKSDNIFFIFHCFLKLLEYTFRSETNVYSSYESENIPRSCKGRQMRAVELEAATAPCSWMVTRREVPFFHCKGTVFSLPTVF